MQFPTPTTLLPLLLLSALPALAAPAPAAADTSIQAAPLLTARDFTDSLNKLTGLQAGGCSVVKCATALAPTVVGCAAAAAEEFINPIADAACIAAAGNAAVNQPAQCKGCNPLDDE